MQIFEELDSTQFEAQRQIDVKGVIKEDIILAYTQTNGQTAHKGVSWNSKKGNLTASFIYYPFEYSEQNLKHHLFVCGLAIRELLLEIAPELDIKLKWVNDIIINNKKISGCLKMIYKNHIIFGVGVNLISHPEDTLHLKATDLLTETGITITPEEFAERLNVKIKQQVDLLNQYGFASVRTRWKQCAYMLGKKLKMRDSGIVLFEDIDDDGNMVVKKENEEMQTILSSDCVECNAE